MKAKISDQEKIIIDLLPIDFENTHYGSNTNCALAKAIKRQLHIKNVEVYLTETTFHDTKFIIKKGFSYSDYNFIQEKYQLDPKAKEAIYQVTLIKYN